MSSGSQIIGDLVLQAAVDHVKHGSGKLSVNSEIGFTIVGGNATIATDTTSSLKVRSKEISLQSDVVLLGKAQTVDVAGMVTSPAGNTTAHGNLTVDGDLMVQGASITLGAAGSSTTTHGHLTVNGDLTVTGTTTTVDTVNMTVKDNIIELNSNASLANATTGIIMARNAADHLNVPDKSAAAFLFDEVNDRFSLGYTDKDSPAITSLHADVQVKDLHCAKVNATSISVPGQFDKIEFNISPQDTWTIDDAGTYGAIELIVRGPDGGSHGSWRIAKSSANDASYVLDGKSIAGTDGGKLAVFWPVGECPQIGYDASAKPAGSSQVTYNVRYLTV